MVRTTYVNIRKLASKQIEKLPKHIQEAVATWMRSVELEGIRKVRMLPGYHDEPLKGDRVGQRSVRMSRSYRLFYEELDNGQVILVSVIEVNKHEY